MVRLATFAAFVATAVTVPAVASAQAAGRYICSPGPDGQMSCVPEGAEGPAAPAPAPAPAAEPPPPTRPAPDAAPAPGAPVPQADDRDEPGEAPLATQLAPMAAPQAAPAAPITVVAEAPPPPPPLPVEERKVSSRTHNWMMPTGSMLRAGEAQVSLHELFWAEAAYGVTDRFEINAGMVGPLFLQVGARVGLTPTDSPFKLVVGVSAWVPMLGEDEFDDDGEGGGLHVAITSTVTAAYTTETFSLHASALLAGNGNEEDGEVGAALSAGATLRLNSKMALIGEVGAIVEGFDDDYDVVLSFAGLKFMGRSTDVDIGVVMPTFDFTDTDDDEVHLLPMLSMSHRF